MAAGVFVTHRAPPHPSLSCVDIIAQVRQKRDQDIKKDQEIKGYIKRDQDIKGYIKWDQEIY